MHKLVNTFKESKRIFKKRLHEFNLTEIQSDLLAAIYFYDNSTFTSLSSLFSNDITSDLQALIEKNLLNATYDEAIEASIYTISENCRYLLLKHEVELKKINDALDTPPQKVHVWKSIATIIHYIYAEKQNRPRVWWALLFSVVSAICLALSLFSMQDLTETLSLLAGDHSTKVVNRFFTNLGFLAGFYALQTLFIFLQNFFFVKISENMGFGIRKELFHKIQVLPFSYIDKKSVGSIMSLFTNDVDTVIFTIVQNAATIVNAFLSVIAMMIVMILLNYVLAAIVIVMTFGMLSIIFIFIRKSQPHFMDQQNKLAELNGDVLEAMNVHKMITIFDYQEPMSETFKTKNKSLAKSSYFSQLISGVIYPYNNFVTNFIIGIVSLVLTAIIIGDANFLSLTSPINANPISIMFLFIIVVRQFTTPISNFFFTLNSLQLTFAAVDRVNCLLNEENESSDANKAHLDVKNAEIEFKNVCFKYDKNGKDIIKDLNLTLKPNTVNAIAGPTGSGKTTIISLLTRFYEINSGQILVDGKDISKVTRDSLRNNISIVLQDSFLFSTTILENIRCGHPEATREDVIKAAKLSNAHNFIMRLPQGYDTMINDGAELISEGEKQLISIARAFLSKSKIIIFDEATSYVDTKTEKEIQEAMMKLMKNRTAILIAHRLSTIRDAHQIAIIKDGVLIEKGNHHSLMKEKGFYYRLNNSADADMDIKN